MIPRSAMTMLVVVTIGVVVSAHSGPPYPIVTERPIGGYVVSVWTDPDATDDGSRGGQFWVVLHDGSGRPPAAAATIDVAVKASDRDAPWHRGEAPPVGGDATRRFVALPLDHEGPYAVTVALSGPSGHATLETMVDATYDLRPQPYLIAVYLLPFVLIGGLWVKLMLARRRS